MDDEFDHGKGARNIPSRVRELTIICICKAASDSSLECGAVTAPGRLDRAALRVSESSRPPACPVGTALRPGAPGGAAAGCGNPPRTTRTRRTAACRAAARSRRFPILGTRTRTCTRTPPWALASRPSQQRRREGGRASGRRGTRSPRPRSVLLLSPGVPCYRCAARAAVRQLAMLGGTL